MAPQSSKTAKPKGKGEGKGKNDSSSDHLEPAFADEPVEPDQATESAIDNMTTAGSADISATETPASSTVSESLRKTCQNKKGSWAGQPNIPETVQSKDNALGFLTEASCDPVEREFGPEKNALQDPNARRVPKEHILALFPTEASWREIHNTAVIHNAFARRRIMACILFHCCIKNVEMPQVLQQGDLLQQDQWPYNAIPDWVRQNQLDWLNWMSDLEEAIPHALIQMNWMLLLDHEYKATRPLWNRFWELIHELDRVKKACELTSQVERLQLILNELAEIEVTMATWNRRRHFLQRATIVGKAWEARLHRPPPLWVDWNVVVSDILRAADLNDELSDYEVEDGYESGHVSELDDTESDEEFEL